MGRERRDTDKLYAPTRAMPYLRTPVLSEVKEGGLFLRCLNGAKKSGEVRLDRGENGLLLELKWLGEKEKSISQARIPQKPLEELLKISTWGELEARRDELKKCSIGVMRKDSAETAERLRTYVVWTLHKNKLAQEHNKTVRERLNAPTTHVTSPVSGREDLKQRRAEFFCNEAEISNGDKRDEAEISNGDKRRMEWAKSQKDSQRSMCDISNTLLREKVRPVMPFKQARKADGSSGRVLYTPTSSTYIKPGYIMPSLFFCEDGGKLQEILYNREMYPVREFGTEVKLKYPEDQLRDNCFLVLGGNSGAVMGYPANAFFFNYPYEILKGVFDWREPRNEIFAQYSSYGASIPPAEAAVGYSDMEALLLKQSELGLHGEYNEVLTAYNSNDIEGISCFYPVTSRCFPFLARYYDMIEQHKRQYGVDKPTSFYIIDRRNEKIYTIPSETVFAAVSGQDDGYYRITPQAENITWEINNCVEQHRFPDDIRHGHTGGYHATPAEKVATKLRNSSFHGPDKSRKR